MDQQFCAGCENVTEANVLVPCVCDLPEAESPLGGPSVRFEVDRNPEPDDNSTLYFVTVIDALTDEVIERHTCEDGYGFVGAWRESEAKLAAYPDKYLIEIDSEGLPW